jgi:hypothetical protein
VVAADDNKRKLFVFTCTSDYSAIANKLDVPKSRLGTCIDSGASQDYCSNHSKFITYKAVNQKITTADGRRLSAIGMGDLELELPNGSEKTKTVFKDAINALDMAFTLISISRLDNARFSVNFDKGMCTIKNPKGQMIVTIPHSEGLYKIANKPSNVNETANMASKKMSISEAHHKLGHIAHLVIKHAV